MVSIMIHGVGPVTSAIGRNSGTEWVTVTIGHDVELTIFAQRADEFNPRERTLAQVAEGLAGAQDNLWMEKQAKQHDEEVAAGMHPDESNVLSMEQAVAAIHEANKDIPF